MRGPVKEVPMKIGILGGTGRMGRGLADSYARRGHEVFLGSRSPDQAQRIRVPERARNHVRVSQIHSFIPLHSIVSGPTASIA